MLRETIKDRLQEKNKAKAIWHFFQVVLISWMITLSLYLIWQVISFPKLSEPAINSQKMAILAKKIIFSYTEDTVFGKKIIFSDEVNGDRYWAMLKEFLFTKIEEDDMGNIWLQQNDATCHTAEATLDVLRPVYEDRIICAVSLKIADKPETIDALKDNIRDAIG